MPGNAGCWRFFLCATTCIVAVCQCVTGQGIEQSAFISMQQREAATAQPTTAQPMSTAQPNAIDAGTVAAGMAAFARSCTSCHDEQRSLSKSKSYSGWLATVQRMASKTGADISSADVAPIAAYL